MADNKAVVDGVGGVFIYANDAKALADWYVAHLGLPLGTWEEGKNYGAQLGDSELIFSIQKSPTPLSGERNQVTVNYRVGDLAGLKRHLRAAGIEIEKEQDSEYGDFAWVRDPEGNRIELYQPAG